MAINFVIIAGIFFVGIAAYFLCYHIFSWFNGLLDYEKIASLTMFFLLMLIPLTIILCPPPPGPGPTENNVIITMHDEAIVINLTDGPDVNRGFDLINYTIKENGTWLVGWFYKVNGRTYDEVRHHNVTTGNETYTEHLIDGGRYSFRYLEITWNGLLERKYVR